MVQVEKDTGRRLDWAAVNHHNTDNPHVHVVVRGLDRDGDEVRIDGRYIAQEMRWRAQEIVSARASGDGPAGQVSHAKSGHRARAANEYRSDHRVARHAGEHRFAGSEFLREPGGDGRLRIARLSTLETLRLAKIERPGVWRLEPEWQQSLKVLAEYRDVLDRLRPRVGDRAVGFQVVDERNPVGAFEGRVIGKGLDDELGGRMFLAVQAPGGDHFYVRLAPNVAGPLREGDTIRVGFDADRWLKPADQIVARFAERNGGIYDPARHQRKLERLQRSRLPLGGPTPAEQVAANVRRLERLERFQLVARLPDGRWQIRPDLVSQLKDRERTHPQPRMTVARTGPERTASPQERGQRPEQVVQAQPQLPDLTRERAVLGQAHRIERDVSPTSPNPPQFRGRAIDVVTTQSGREYARIVNYARGEFTLIPKPPDWERLRGHSVDLTVDRERKLVIQLDRGFSR